VIRLSSYFLLISLALGAVQLDAAIYTDRCGPADQFIPGATITAIQSDKKVTAFTDENGRFSWTWRPEFWDNRSEYVRVHASP